MWECSDPVELASPNIGENDGEGDLVCIWAQPGSADLVREWNPFRCERGQLKGGVCTNVVCSHNARFCNFAC